MSLKRLSTVLFSFLLCVTIFAGCDIKSSEQKQNEVNADFAEAVQKFKNASHVHGVNLIDATDSSMFNLETIETYGDTLSSIKLDFEINLELQKDGNGNATDAKRDQSITTITTTYSNGDIATATSYELDGGYVYYNDGLNKIKHKNTADFNSTDSVFSYLNPEYLEEISLSTENNQKIFNFKVMPQYKPLLTNFSPIDDMVRKNSNIEIVGFYGNLVVDGNSDQVSLTVNIEYENRKTNERLTYTLSQNRNNSTHELQFPNDLKDYEEKK